MAQAQDKPKVKYDPDPYHGGSAMTIEPLDPRQGQPLDTTIPHAMDTTLPDVNPQIVQPKISPAQSPGILHANPGTVKPGEYDRPAFNPVSKT